MKLHFGGLSAVCALLCLAALGCGDDDNNDSSTSAQGGDGGQGAIGGGGDGGAGATGGAEGGAGGQGGQGGMGACENVLPNITVAPAKLSETGLYADISTQQIAAHAEAFAPQFELWSDGAVKQRWAYLGECEAIDNSDEESWSFPVGTRMWKEFRVGGQLIETRLVHRFGPGDDDYLFASYMWDMNDSDADLVPIGGMQDVKGTSHDIPSELDCRNCHGSHEDAPGGTDAHYLGFDAIQLSHNGAGLNMASLSNDGRLSAPNAAGYTVPGTPIDVAALGYLHANCGNCHNMTGEGVFVPPMDLRIQPGVMMVEQTAAYMDTVNQAGQSFSGVCQGIDRIRGMDVMNSCVHLRMATRDPGVMPQVMMPPLGTEGRRHGRTRRDRSVDRHTTDAVATFEIGSRCRFLRGARTRARARTLRRARENARRRGSVLRPA